MQTSLLTTAEVAVRVGKTVATVNRWAAECGLRPALTLPGPKGARLYDPAEVDRFLAERVDGRSLRHQKAEEATA